MPHFVNYLIPSFHHLGFFGYWFVFFISLLESIPFIGFIIPGGTIVVFFGYLSAQNLFHFGNLIWFAAIGAILGDNIGYYLGECGTKYFKYENRFLKLSHLEKGNEFFKKHGNKSVFLARFIGPIRPIVPFIAGLSKMDRKKFMTWNILGAFGWAISHLTLGYFFGSAWKTVEMWTTRGGIFILASLIFFIIIWYALKNINKFFEFLGSLGNLLAEVVIKNESYQEFALKHPKFIDFVKRRFRKKDFFGAPFTLLSLLFVLVLFFFVSILTDVAGADSLIAIDAKFESLIYMFRENFLTKIFLWITIWGNWQIVVSVLALACFFFFIAKKRTYIFPLLLSVAGSEFFVMLVKNLIQRNRPSGIIPYYFEKSLSFPSGHATIAISLYCFLAYVFIRNLHDRGNKVKIFFCALVVAILLGFSRLYLGVHFLSDVLGGYLLGFLWLIISIGLSEWLLSNKKQEQVEKIPARKAKKIFSILVVILLAIYIAYGIQYKPLLNTSRIQTSTENISESLDISAIFFGNKLPRYSESLTGKKQEPLNLILVAKDDDALISDFEKAGCFMTDPISVLSFAKSIFLGSSYKNAPLTASFWNNQVYDFGFKKMPSLSNSNEGERIRVWKTNRMMSDGNYVYVASASLDKTIRRGITHRTILDVDTERELLYSDFQNADLVLSYEGIQFVEPVLNKNLPSNRFFSDGRAYVIYLK